MAGKKGEIPVHVQKRKKQFFHKGIEHPIIKILENVEDPRETSLSFRHSLTSVLFMTLVATICGATDWAKVVVMSQGMVELHHKPQARCSSYCRSGAGALGRGKWVALEA